MKRTIYLLVLLTTIFAFSACSTAYTDMVENITVTNLNYSCGSYITWNPIDNANSYNIYSVSKDNEVTKIKTLTGTTAFVEPASTQLAISAEVNGKETYLSEMKKGENTWWTKVTCKKVDTGFSLSWDSLPIAEDYVLISSYEVTSVMIEYITARYELKVTELEDFNNKAASSNPYNAVYLYRKCKSLNTTNNNTVYTGNDFTGSYSNYVCLFAKVGNAYYQISDRFSMK